MTEHSDPERPEVALGVAAVARRLGVATGTLRTWDRRYGLGPRAHQPGSPRRYTARDVARLQVMRGLLLEGATAAEAARVALAGDQADPATPAEWARGRRERPGGGRVVPLRDGSPAARGLARAAMSLDADACTDLVLAAVQRDGVVAAWDELVAPVLTGLAERRRSTGNGSEAEHLFSEATETALRVGARRSRNTFASARRPVLIASLAPEAHRLTLVALSAALTERRVASRLLGAGLPERGLVDAMVRTGPAAVVLWSLGSPGPMPDPAALGAVRPRPALLLGGPGYRDRGRDGHVVSTLAEAVDLLQERLGAGAPAGRRSGRRSGAPTAR